MRAGYADTKTTSGALVFPGSPKSSELTWADLRGVAEPLAMAQGMFRHATHHEAGWDWRTFDLDREIAAADAAVGFINAVNPDLSAFKKRGGKLLIYHGWSDAVVAPANTVNYLNSLTRVPHRCGRTSDGSR